MILWTDFLTSTTVHPAGSRKAQKKKNLLLVALHFSTSYLRYPGASVFTQPAALWQATRKCDIGDTALCYFYHHLCC